MLGLSSALGDEHLRLGWPPFRPYSPAEDFELRCVTLLPGEITRLLSDWREGHADALARLAPLIQTELHNLALSHMRRERKGHTLQPTALVNEVYVRLCGSSLPRVENRRQFYALAGRLMRQILVDHSRKFLAGKRGSGQAKLSLDETFTYVEDGAAGLLALNEAMDRLAEIDPRKAQAVELQFFTGLTLEEIADVIGTSMMTVRRDLRFASAFLAKQLKA